MFHDVLLVIINISLSVDVEITRNVYLQDCRWIWKPRDILNCKIIGGYRNETEFLMMTLWRVYKPQ